MSHHPIRHIANLKKKIFLKFFLGFFVNLLTSTYPNSKKSICPKNLKVLPIRKRQHLFIQTIIGDFVAIFEKKSDQKKIFFFKNFFFNFWKSPFLSIIRRDLTKNFFWKFQKKKFQKKNFFQMINESTCVVRHKLKLYKTKWPHLRNTWIAFLWPKCLYYCHTSPSKYKS